MRLPLAAVLLTLALAGCRHRGAAWSEPSPPAAGPVELFVLGQPREAAATRAVTRELDRSLQAAEAAGRTPIIVWLGTDYGAPGSDRAGRCPGPGPAHAGPVLSELDAVVTAAVERGATAWGLPGPDGFRCHVTGLEAAMRPLPYRHAGFAYVLRVSSVGTVTLASSCEAQGCTVVTSSDDTLVELVALDTSIWHYPALAGDDITQALLAQQAALLASLAAQPGPPRILLSPIPLESAGSHGLGGRRQRAAFHYAPPFVQQAIADGLFVGVIGALERDLQVSEDLSNAIVRGERVFIEAPVFGIVSGAAGGAGHTLPTSRGNSLLPDLHSEHPGFVRLSFAGEQAQLHVHARVGGRWQVAGMQLSLAPEPHPPLRETPTIQPCPSCDPQRGAPDGDAFVPRTERQH